MQITVFGANGRVGRLIVQKALVANYKVVAFVHGLSELKASEDLRICSGDIYNAQDVDRAIMGTDVVIGALGSWGTPNKDILSSGMKNIIPAMKRHGVKRIITLTGADASIAGETNDIVGRLCKLLIKMFANKILKDGQDHIRLLAESNLDWTVVRSPVMNLWGNSINATLTKIKPRPWATINRGSVARAMLELVADSTYSKQAPYITRK